MTDSNGWAASAEAWISEMGDRGDWGRRHVLDAPMLAAAAATGARRAVDVGCGEGRFCRQLQALGLHTLGIDPTTRLIDEARRRDPAGDYRVGRAEALDLADAAVDLAVYYLSLIDIDDYRAAIDEAWRVLAPGGTLLIANLQAFNTASPDQGWTHEPDGSRRFSIDHYFVERPDWVAWRGIRIRNWHRPLSAYFNALLGRGFQLRQFDEPLPQGVDDAKAERYRRVPNFLIMRWQKPG